MTNMGRNDPCTCGSGKKYKKCCEPRDQAARAERARAVPPLPPPARAWIAVEDELDQVSNAVVDLIDQGRLDDAEEAAHRLLRDYPEVHDGLERLGMVYEARGDTPRAIEMYQRALDFTLDNDGYDEPARDWYREKLISLRARLRG